MAKNQHIEIRYFLAYGKTGVEIWSVQRLNRSATAKHHLTLSFKWAVHNSNGVYVCQIDNLKCIKRPRGGGYIPKVITGPNGWMATKFYKTKEELIKREMHYLL